MNYSNLRNPFTTQSEPIPIVPEFKILTLGTRGSGKTVFLSSLWHQLSIDDGSRGYFVTIPDAQRCDLQKNIDILCDSQPEWPAGTSCFGEYNFEVIYFNPRREQQIPMFKFTYFDYPGGWVSTGGIENFSIRNLAMSADAILVLLDGKKIVDALENVATDGASIFNDLSVICPVVFQCVGRPIHFIITKCDLLNPNKHNLKAVRSLLTTYRPFAALIDAQFEPYQMHLIPVSAVGPNFAQYDPDQHLMLKFPEVRLRPMNVEFSIILTLVDKLQYLSKALGVASRPLFKMNLKKWLLNGIVKLSNTAPDFGPFLSLFASPQVEAAFLKLIKGFDTILAKRTHDLEEKLKFLAIPAADHQMSIVILLKSVAVRYAQLLNKFPESKLR